MVKQINLLYFLSLNVLFVGKKLKVERLILKTDDAVKTALEQYLKENIMVVNSDKRLDVCKKVRELAPGRESPGG